MFGRESAPSFLTLLSFPPLPPSSFPSPFCSFLSAIPLSLPHWNPPPLPLSLSLPPSPLAPQHCNNRSLREELYKEFITRASSGDIDNAPLIATILKLKQEKAKLLGYDTHAQVSLGVIRCAVCHAVCVVRIMHASEIHLLAGMPHMF